MSEHPLQIRKDLDISSKTTIRGIVNGSPVEGTVTAAINTGRGGSSACQFSQLPGNFNAATLSTHA
jgi:hypothetical protein